MVIISKLVGRFLGVSAIISVPGGNAFGLFAQGRSLPGYAELQSLNSEWTAGVVKAFEDNGATLQEVTGTEYAEIWAILANEEQPTGEEKKGKKTKADKTKGKKTKGEKTKNERDKWYKIKWEDLPNILKAWIIANPWQSAFIVVNGVVFFAPAAASGPVLWIFGFTSTGPRAASFASFLHSKIGLVTAKSAFAFLQSAGMGGYGVAAVNAATQCVVAANGLGVAVWGWAWGNRNATRAD